MQGDVVGIVDSTGNTIATYAYDAWGNITSSTGSLAEINPIRYRGYYYDDEIEMYYLQSRYYDQNVGRFINSDTTEALSSLDNNIIYSNLYVYCFNEPILLNDPSGMGSSGFVGAGIQIELCWGAATGGIEIIWYFSSRVNVSGRNRAIPYIYFYGAASIGTSAKTKDVLKSMIKNRLYYLIQNL